MGYGYSSYEFELIDENVLAKVCPDTYDVFNNLRTTINASDAHCFEDFAEYIAHSKKLDDEFTPINGLEPTTFFDLFKNAYNSLQADVKDKVGITMVLSYHDSQNDGSRYDDVDGAFFEALNVFTLTPEAKLARELSLSSPAQYVTGG